MSQQTNIKAIKCHQWLSDWDSFSYGKELQRTKPKPTMYLFTLSAIQLRKLSGVFDRKRNGGDASGIQRAHEKSRSESISKFVRHGYPYSELSTKKQQDPENDTLKKPGWLPTSIVVNILGPSQVRRDKTVATSDLITVSDYDESLVEISLPPQSNEHDWEPESFPPIEIIDGQHRLFAFDRNSDLPDDFQLPVVAFHELDIVWQAYLFWSINVSPKRINASHAYDLFPLLRTQDWLEKSPVSHVYREARAQELTEILFRHHASPWLKRINMLGVKNFKGVSQNGWVQSIFNSFLSPGLGARSRKGLFASNINQTLGPLQWNRPQQAAFLIYFWSVLQKAVKNNKDWADMLRSKDNQIDLRDDYDLAFHGPNTLLNQEQGVRAVSITVNDILFSLAEEIGLEKWFFTDIDAGETKDEDIDACIEHLKKQPFIEVLDCIANELASFDWRSFNAPDLNNEQLLERSGFRGTGGYNRLRSALLYILSKSHGRHSSIAKHLFDASNSN